MFIPIIFIFSVLYTEISTADNYYDKTFHNTRGPYFISKEAVNWTDAKIGCKNADLELASVLTEKEQTALKIFIRENELVPEDVWSGYWLSGIRHEDGYYYWDSTGTKISFWGWAWGEPSHAYGREDCIELKNDLTDLRWNDYFCDETRRYICQKSRKLEPNNVKKNAQKRLISKEWQQGGVEKYTKASEIEKYTDFEKTEKSVFDYTIGLKNDVFNYTLGK